MIEVKVVNVRDAPRGSFIYVGRMMPGRFQAHPLANPFRLPRGPTEEDCEACKEDYSEWLDDQPRHLLQELAAKVLKTRWPLGFAGRRDAIAADVLARRVEAILNPAGARTE